MDEAIPGMNVEGHFMVSSSLIGGWEHKDLFAFVIANETHETFRVDGVHINKGDYVVATTLKDQIRDGDIVVWIVDGVPLLRRINIDGVHVALLSEAKSKTKPIYLHRDDLSSMTGKVVRCFKHPKIKITHEYKS